MTIVLLAVGLVAAWTIARARKRRQARHAGQPAAVVVAVTEQPRHAPDHRWRGSGGRL